MTLPAEFNEFKREALTQKPYQIDIMEIDDSLHIKVGDQQYVVKRGDEYQLIHEAQLARRLDNGYELKGKGIFLEVAGGNSHFHYGFVAWRPFTNQESKP